MRREWQSFLLQPRPKIKILTVDGAVNDIGGGAGALILGNVAEPAASLLCSSGLTDLR